MTMNETPDVVESPPMCPECGAYLTDDARYVGWQCCCVGSPLVARFLTECDGCESPGCELCYAKLPEAG